MSGLSCATTTKARASDAFVSSLRRDTNRSTRRVRVGATPTRGGSKISSFLEKESEDDEGVRRHLHRRTSFASTRLACFRRGTLIRAEGKERRALIVANSSSSSSSNKEKFERLKDMLDAVSEALDVSSKLQLSLDEANGKVARLESKVKERDRLLSIVRGLEIELADSYTPKEVDELVKNLKQERERELDQLKKELEETKSLREKVAEIVSLEKEKESAKKEALENGEKLIKAELNLENLKRESSMQSMELQGKMENAEREAKQLKAEIRRLETRMADMVDIEESDEEIDRLKGELEDAKVKSETVPILQQALKEMTTERDDLRKLLREVEAAMAEMTENKEVIELAKEKNNLSVKSQVAQFQLKKKEFTQKVSKQSSKTMIKAETDKEVQGKKKPFKRAPVEDFVMKRKTVSAENVSTTEEFTVRKGAFQRTPGQFTMRKFAFDSPSKRRVSVPTTAFKRTGEFELRRFIFTSDEVEVDSTVSGGFKRTPGQFTMRRFNFRDDDSGEEEKTSSSSTLFKF